MIEKPLILTTGELLRLAEIVDSERERVREMREGQPRESLTSAQRNTYIDELNILTERLVAQLKAVENTTNSSD